MIYHVLNGDALAHGFPEAKIPGEIAMVREGLIEGDSSGETLDDFWRSRAGFMGLTSAEYHKGVASEFQKLIEAPDKSEFNLWFEYDLFCQVNMWFVISLLKKLPREKSIFAVYTSHLKRDDKHFWTGYGPATTEELKRCFAKRTLLGERDVRFGEGLWKAYRNGDLEALRVQSKTGSAAYPYIEEVVKAHADRFPQEGETGRPERVVEEIVRNVSTDFPAVLAEFWKRESIYGFGDLQLRTIYDKVLNRLGTDNRRGA